MRAKHATDIVSFNAVVHDVAVHSAMSQVRVRIVCNHLISVIAQELAKGNRVRISGFGQFKTQTSKSPGFRGTPNSSGKIRKAVRFTAAKGLKKYLLDAAAGKSAGPTE